MPAETTGLRGVAFFAAGLAAQGMTPARGIFDAIILPVDGVTTGQQKVSVARVVRIVADKRDTDALCSGKAATLDAMGAFRSVSQDHAGALDLVLTARMAPDDQTRAVDHDGDGVKAFCQRYLTHVVALDGAVNRDPGVTNANV